MHSKIHYNNDKGRICIPAKKKAINTNSSIANGFKRCAVTPRVKGILMEIVECDVCGRLKEIYLKQKY